MNPASRTTSSQTNRRSSRRFGLNSHAKVECRKGALGLGVNLLVKTLDVSETGIRLVLKIPLEVGQEVEVLLQGGGLPRPLKRLGRVIWALRLEDGSSCAGVHFDRALPYAQMLRITKTLR